MADQTFEYNTSGLIPSPSDAVVTATALNTTGTVYYQFYKKDDCYTEPIIVIVAIITFPKAIIIITKL